MILSYDHLFLSMDLRSRYGSRALVAGASEGIGAAYATFLAMHGIDLLLVARRKEPLSELAANLTAKYKVSVRCIELDLSDVDAAQRLTEAPGGDQIDILVYNAALSVIGPFTGSPADVHDRAAAVNMVTPMNLVYTLGKAMLARGRGAIVLMTSMAGLQGSAYLAMYAATKAFNLILAESLWYEWQGSGVDIIACCAGATATPGYVRSSPAKAGLFAPRVLMPEEVPAECFRRIGRRPSFITGRSNRMASFFMHRILPRRAAIRIMGNNTRKMYRL
jgi:short-subunit dehydrogenase